MKKIIYRTYNNQTITKLNLQFIKINKHKSYEH